MPNRLATAESLYLRKHADNPIAWWSWGPEALETAMVTDRPIFLSIGYSSCHWCTVMEGEAFSDMAIAEFLNTHFIPIKVDREERPDVDSIYMQALQMMTGQGGWPLNIFLTPAQRLPFYGGTYFPIDQRFGRPGFLQVLQSVLRFYQEEKEKLNQFTGEIYQVLQSNATLAPQAIANPTALLQAGQDKTAQILAPSAQQAGRPSFPMMPYAQWLLQSCGGDFSTDAGDIARERGQNLVLGGIYDHVAGGFHRYTVDATWTVPHFEKMLYDNGQILEFLANLWGAGHQTPEIERAITGTVSWLQREMTAPQGYFYAAQDADNFVTPTALEPEEGAFYVWGDQELDSLFGETAVAELAAWFDLKAGGNFEGHTVLQRTQSGTLPDGVEQSLNQLFQARYGGDRQSITIFPPAKNNQEAKAIDWSGRIPPVTDTKMIVAWNSLMISGLARAAMVLKTPMYLTLAINAADFIDHHQWQGDRLFRLSYDGTPHTAAQSEDYALWIKALLDLHQARPTEPRWLTTAIQAQTQFDQAFWCDSLGGYFNAARDQQEDLLVPERGYQDNATPAANGIALGNLVRLAGLTGNTDYLQKVEVALQSFTSVMEQAPAACPTLLAALQQFQTAITVKGNAATLQFLAESYYPLVTPVLSQNLPAGAIALVCQGTQCLEPAQSYGQLIEQLAKLSAP